MKRIHHRRSSLTSRQDIVAKVITGFFGTLFCVMFLSVIGFIIAGSIPGFKQFGFSNIFFTTTYDLENNKAGIWLPLCVTMLVSCTALLIGGPIGIKTATFIKFRMPKKASKYVKMLIELLSNFPSVVFGLFVLTVFGPVLQTIFHMPTSYNLITCSLMLSFMIMPTVITLNLSAFDSVDTSFLFSPQVLGNTKTAAIYKVYKKQIRGKVVISLITGISRALGETMAVSMILQSQNFNAVFNNGFGAVWTSYLKTIGCLISSNMFAEVLSEGLKGLLFGYGLFLLIFVMLLNGIVKIIFRQKKTTKRNPAAQAIGDVIMFIPRQIKVLWNKILNRGAIKVTTDNYVYSLPKYFNQRANKANANGKVYDGWKIFWETLCFTICMAFILWMAITVIVNGVIGWQADSCTVFQFSKDTTGQALVNTLLIILVSVGIGFIIAMSTAILINEFMKDGKAKSGFMFFIDSLGATPSIIYGMFGLIFFLQILGISNAGHSGKSILAAGLTLIFVLLPAFTRTLIQALQATSNEVRQASYALGVSKWQTITKLVIPNAIQHILTGIVLSIGRVLAETAPIYLTAGLGGGTKIGYLSAGQTLTTRIYSQINSNNVTKAHNIMYECALLTVILIIIILIFVDIIIPKIFEHKRKKSSSGINLAKPKRHRKSKAEIKQSIMKFVANLNLNIRV